MEWLSTSALGASLLALISNVQEAGTTPVLQALRTNQAMQLRMEELAREYPAWFRCGSLGTSFLGRSIPYLHVSAHETPGSKRGVWIDAGIHGHELAAPEMVLGLAEALELRIASGDAPEWLERWELFLVPVINVDARELCMLPPYPLIRRNLRPIDDDGDGRVDESAFADLNGDGRISSLQPRGQGFTLECQDSDRDGQWGEDLPGGIDLNRNFPSVHHERAANWIPERETRAVISFVRAHPRITLAISYHTSRDMFIEPYVALSEQQKHRYGKLAKHYLGFFEGEVWRLHEEPDKYGIALPRGGMNVEWFQATHGATAFVLEIGWPHGAGDVEAKPESIVLPNGTRATTFRVERGLFRQVERRLDANLDVVRERHAAYLQDLVRLLDEGVFD